MRKTRIICTLGPAASNKEFVRQLVLHGMDIARLNFSHGTCEEHRVYFNVLQDISHELEKPIGILQDLEGYEIRTGTFKGREYISLEDNDYLWLTSDEPTGENSVSVSYLELYRFVQPGDKVFIDDGKIELQVEDISGKKIKTRVIIGGKLGEHKGINIPSLDLDFPSLTQKDEQDIYFGIEMGVDYIAQSFVREAKDILAIKDILKKEKKEHVSVFAKIEDKKGVCNIDEIIEVSDGIMIARGDMGVSLPRAQVPLVQKMIIRKCNQAGKPVITATQMLDSMIRSPHPTRAEVADVANAIIDGTDIVMLSGETAIGSYPCKAVQEMRNIAEVTEASLKYELLLQEKGIVAQNTVSNSLAFVVRDLSELIRAEAIMAFTLSGNTAMAIAKYRPRARIIALTPYLSVAKKLLLYWGVEVMLVDKVTCNIDMHFNKFLTEAIDKNIVGKEKLVVLTGGIEKEKDKPSGTLKILST